MIDSPTPMNMRGKAMLTKPRAAPEAAVSMLHTAKPIAINRVRLTVSASAPMNNPAAEYKEEKKQTSKQAELSV